jgi:hypothetical protein
VARPKAITQILAAPVANMNLTVFLIGLFVVPTILLMWGQGLRKRSRHSQQAFWGAVIGHCVAGLLAIVLGMIPPEAWTEGETVRGFAGFWALLLLPVIGAAGGSLRARVS